MKSLLFAVFLLCCPNPLGAGPARVEAPVSAYAPKFFPFQSGERALYRATWNGIPVGTAEVHTRPVTIDGRPYYHVHVEARSSKVVDVVWKMRDSISSVFAARSLAPSRFVFKQRENSRVIDTDARYDPVDGKWAVDRRQKGKKRRVYEFDSENTLDPITAVYVARSTDFKVGDHLRFNVFGGRHRYLLELSVEARETIQLDERTSVEAFRIVPKVTNLTKKGYASRMNEAAIWISADERRLPVRLKSKIFVGTVEMELVHDHTGAHAADVPAARGS